MHAATLLCRAPPRNGNQHNQVKTQTNTNTTGATLTGRGTNQRKSIPEKKLPGGQYCNSYQQHFLERNPTICSTNTQVQERNHRYGSSKRGKICCEFKRVGGSRDWANHQHMAPLASCSGIKQALQACSSSHLSSNRCRQVYIHSDFAQSRAAHE
mgnify:CR=1 FL=1